MLICLAFYSLGIGDMNIKYAHIINIVLNPNDSLESMIIHETRIPRVVGAILIGASLALSGSLYQGIIGNPLVSPGILGVLNGASFGAALGMLLNFNLFGIEILCFLFGLLAMIISLLLSLMFDGRQNLLMLILGGIISSAFFSAGVSILKLIADPYNSLPNIIFWLMGSLAYIQEIPLLILGIIFVVSLLISFILSREIDILNIDEDSAESIGINVKRIRLIFICLATLLASSSVAIGGLIGWIGLVIPHISRFIIGANHRLMLIFCSIFGGGFLLFCDNLSRSMSNSEIPIGILTSIFLIPVFSIILIINKKTEQ